MGEKASWGLEEGDELVPGRTVIEHLGGGSLYEVYLTFDQEMYALVVAKLVRPDKLESASAMKGFRREAEILNSLSHPVIVRLYEAATEGPRPHLLLEFLEGPTLRRLVRRHGALPVEQLLPLALHLCSALHYLHRKELVHLDVKPGNIVMGPVPRLTDLSIARTLEKARELKTPVGTPRYMAPEQCRPEEFEVGPPSDVWGLGVSLYEAASGKPAFEKGKRESESPSDRYPQLDEDPAPLPRFVPEVLKGAIYECLHKDPRKRPSPAEVALRLEPVVAGLPSRPVLRRLRPRLR